MTAYPLASTYLYFYKFVSNTLIAQLSVYLYIPDNSITYIICYTVEDIYGRLEWYSDDSLDGKRHHREYSDVHLKFSPLLFAFNSTSSSKQFNNSLSKIL